MNIKEQLGKIWPLEAAVCVAANDRGLEKKKTENPRLGVYQEEGTWLLLFRESLFFA